MGGVYVGYNKNNLKIFFLSLHIYLAENIYTPIIDNKILKYIYTYISIITLSCRPLLFPTLSPSGRI